MKEKAKHLGGSVDVRPRAYDSMVDRNIEDENLTQKPKCTCEQPVKMKGLNQCWRCKRYLCLCILLASVLFSCSDYQRVRYVCSCEQNEKIESFLRETIGAANNMSDEEMEDVIYQLHKTAVQLNCSQKLIWFTHEGAYIPEKNQLDSCQNVVF